MKYDEQEYFQELMNTVMGWKLSGSQMAVLLCIFRHLFSAKKDKVRISTNDFLHDTHYSRQPIVDATQYLVQRSIIGRERDTDNKGYLYSIEIYDMSDGEKEEGVMQTYKKNGNGYANWDNVPSQGKKQKSLQSKEKRYRYRSVDVDDWNLDDFSYFAKDLTVFRAEKVWNFDMTDVNLVFNSSFRRNQSFVNIIDYLNNHSGGHYCKLLLKAYIEWYIDNVFRDVAVEIEPKNGEKQFAIGHYMNKYHMQTFLNKHGISENISSVQNVEVQLASYSKNLKKKAKQKKSIHLITLKDMEDYYKGGISTLLSECGIVLSGNFLTEYKGKSFVDSAKEIGAFLGDLNLGHKIQRQALQNIIYKTCLGSPYYKTMKFLNWHVLYKDIFAQLKDEFDISGFEITNSRKRNSYKFFVEKETVQV